MPIPSAAGCPLHLPGTSAASEVRELRAQLETANAELERLREHASFTRQARGVAMPHDSCAPRGMERPLVACGGGSLHRPRGAMRGRDADKHARMQSARLPALPVVGLCAEPPSPGPCSIAVRGDAGMLRDACVARPIPMLHAACGTLRGVFWHVACCMQRPPPGVHVLHLTSLRVVGCRCTSCAVRCVSHVCASHGCVL